MIGVAQVYIPVNEEREEETARLMNFLKHDDYLLYVIAYQFFVEGKRHFEIADRHKFSRKSGAVSKKIAKVISYVHSRHSAGERLALAV